jgi:hypothetical protein
MAIIQSLQADYTQYDLYFLNSFLTKEKWAFDISMFMWISLRATSELINRMFLNLIWQLNPLVLGNLLRNPNQIIRNRP